MLTCCLRALCVADDLPDPDYDEEGPGDDSNGHVPYTVNFDDWQKMSKQRGMSGYGTMMCLT